jgi:hypothetical protein
MRSSQNRRAGRHSGQPARKQRDAMRRHIERDNTTAPLPIAQRTLPLSLLHWLVIFEPLRQHAE